MTLLVLHFYHHRPSRRRRRRRRRRRYRPRRVCDASFRLWYRMARGSRLGTLVIRRGDRVLTVIRRRASRRRSRL